MEDREVVARKEPSLRFPRQIEHFHSLVDYILNTQDKPHLRRALQVYFERLSRYYYAFLGGTGAAQGVEAQLPLTTSPLTPPARPSQT